MKRLLHQRNAGFSLIEVMVAISVLSIVVLAVSLLPALSLGRNNDARTYALNTAREVLDAYRSEWQDRTKFQASLAPANLPTSSKLRFGCELQPATVVAYAIDPISFTLQPTVGIPSVQQLTVTVTCPNGGTTLSTYIGDPVPAGS